ncbi:MAG: Magnesium and cobalt efflux protein CorC [uncultured Thiotrichaceae bacterium]|uniref:Magnesium and cobalt efflux protein CorC n=1 Tax=uncultured Thiotrichaceae bacterium TaxID=298394 RepID=A0A6S6S8V8_9GAMM|nr:MAG: Magnesium and cobalt efflux protein CorC [uncultured Thiotrichaceae bacterium]
MTLESIPLWVQFAGLFGLFLLSGFFSGSETALMSLNRYKLRHQAEQGHVGALLAQQLLDKPDRLIGLILLGNNFINVLITQLATLIGFSLFGSAGLAITTGLLTLFLLIFAEVMPKTLAALHPERIAFPASHIYTGMLKVAWPLVWLINIASNSILRLFRMRPDVNGNIALNREELRSIMHTTGPHIPKAHLDMLISVLDLESTTVEDVMIPRNQILGLDMSEDWSEIEEQLLHSQFTRMLVFDDNLDNILGFIHMRKILPLFQEGKLDRKRLLQAIRPAYFVPESTTLAQQLLNFREASRRIGIVVDEYGEIQGLLTIEDILEEIVGEFSTVPMSHSREIQEREDGSHWLDGATAIREVNRQLDTQLSTDGPKTINGLIIEYLESIPVPGMTVLIDNHPMEIRKTRNNAVKTLILYPRIDRKQDNNSDE